MTAPGLPPIDGTWYCDLWDPNLKILHRVRTTLFDGASAYQAIEVVDTCGFGRMLVLDGLPQAAEKDEMVYARALAWPALLARSGPTRVLITGGGDGHVLREVLRFPNVTSAVVCDIDPLVAKATQAHAGGVVGGEEQALRVAEGRHVDLPRGDGGEDAAHQAAQARVVLEVADRQLLGLGRAHAPRAQAALDPLKVLRRVQVV